MARIRWEAWTKIEASGEQVEVTATCKADATAGNDGQIQVDVEIHTRPSRTKQTITVDATIGKDPNLAALLELCSKLKKDKITTLLVSPGQAEKGKKTVHVNAILLESLRLNVLKVNPTE